MSLVFQGPTSKMLPHCCYLLSSSLSWFLSSPSTRPFWYWSASSPLQKICNCGLDPCYTKPVQLDLFCPIYQITWFDLIWFVHHCPNQNSRIARLKSYLTQIYISWQKESLLILLASLGALIQSLQEYIFYHSLSTEHKSRSSHHIAQEFVVQGAITW